MLSVILFASCSSKYDKDTITQYFKEVKELNQLLINNKQQLRGSEGLHAISENIPESNNFIKLLGQELNLTEIVLYNIEGQETKPGLAYRFGNRITE